VDTIQDFEDILWLLSKHNVRYLIVGGLAVIFHAKPRYTKDIDIWLDSRVENVKNANKALEEFGSPVFLSVPVKEDEILQLGVAPDRIDFLLSLQGVSFENAWRKKIVSRYGDVDANWIDIDTLIEVKQQINSPRHQEDVKILLMAKQKQQPDNPDNRRT